MSMFGQLSSRRAVIFFQQLRGRSTLVAALFLAACLIAGYWQRGAVLSWYYCHQLQRAGEGEQAAWLNRLVATDEAAVTRLLSLWQLDDVALCDAARAGLGQLLAGWGQKDPRSIRLADRFFELHASFSSTGQVAALQMLPEILGTGVEAEAKARTIVAAALKDRSVELRCLAVTAALRPSLNLMPAIVPLLDDPDARVRRKALLVLGPEPTGTERPLVETDELLRWLHDPDPEVRQMCEMYLTRSRGRSNRDVRLGRMLTHPDPMKRLQLLLTLPDEQEINVSLWLQRLSKDPDSAVRAGSIRVAYEHHIDFADRIEQMTQHDPDGAVREIAAYYRKLYE